MMTKDLKVAKNVETSSGGNGGNGRPSKSSPNTSTAGPINTKNKKQQSTAAAAATTTGLSARNNTGPSESHSSSQNGHQQDQQVNALRQRRPCLCWCCCCSCSCLALRNNEENKQIKPNNKDPESACDAESPVSLEEIQGWGECFEKLMKNTTGRKVFREFLKCEYSEENICFWLACEELKKESKPELVEEKARLIYEDYISILSPKEVSLDSSTREVVNRKMVSPSPNTFDEAQIQIYTLMMRDSYPRFVNSPLYKKLAQLNNQHRGSVSCSVSNPASRKESLNI